MLNVFVAVDANYLKKSETVVYSLAVNAGERVNLFILHRDIPAAAVARFCRKLSKQNVKCTDIRMSDDLFLSLTDGNAHFSTAMYYRIIAPFVLPRDPDRALYLDADIIVNKDLCAFYNQPFGDRLPVVCPSFDADSDEIARIKEKLGLSAGHVYFNSGVMLMNLEKMRKEKKLPQIMDVILRMQPVLTYPDQDILNKLYEGKVKYADGTYTTARCSDTASRTNPRRKKWPSSTLPGAQSPGLIRACWRRRRLLSQIQAEAGPRARPLSAVAMAVTAAAGASLQNICTPAAGIRSLKKFSGIPPGAKIL